MAGQYANENRTPTARVRLLARTAAAQSSGIRRRGMSAWLTESKLDGATGATYIGRSEAWCLSEDVLLTVDTIEIATSQFYVEKYLATFQ